MLLRTFEHNGVTYEIHNDPTPAGLNRVKLYRGGEFLGGGSSLGDWAAETLEKSTRAGVFDVRKPKPSCSCFWCRFLRWCGLIGDWP